MRQLYTLIYKIDYFRHIYSPNDNICDYYLIDRDCNIYSLYYGKFLDNIISESGYHLINLNTKDGRRIQRRIHRLGMMTFCYFPGCEEFQVDHKDGNKNNNNNISNLEWVLAKENVNRAINMGLRKSWSNQNNPHAKLTDEQVLDIVDMVINNMNNKSIIEKYPNITVGTLDNIIYGNTWNNLISTEMVDQMKIARRIILTTDQKHLICNYFQNNPKIYNYKGAVKDYIIQTLSSLNIPINNSTIRMTKRLYYKYQDPEITSQYNY